MTICRLRISQFRNIQAAELELARVNVFFGANGSGKTSILEAVYLLGSGRSFRVSRLDPLINHEAQKCVVHGLSVDTGRQSTIPIGVSRDRSGRFEGRIGGRNIRSSADLARCLPIQLINAASFDLLEGGPRARRQFLDWGVFHVEHGFHAIWLDVHRALRQRNALLRHARIARAQLDAWDAKLAEGADQLDEFRQRYFDAFYPEFKTTLAQIAELNQVELSYHRGWERGRALSDVLQEQFERDKQRGHTHSGPHRADVRVRVAGQGACDVLSRGQQKLVVCAMKLAQGRLFSRLKEQECVFLVDDLPSELDRLHRAELCRLLGSMSCQVLVSCVEASDLDGQWGISEPGAVRLFHVEHGRPVLCESQEL